MKFVIVFAVLIAMTLANSKDETLRYDVDNIGVDGYKYAYETSGGIKAEESAVLNNVGKEDEYIAVRGSFSYLYDGVTYTVNYVADNNGFQPSADHLPVAPSA